MLRTDLAKFLSPPEMAAHGPLVCGVSIPPTPVELPVDDLASLQLELRQLLLAIVHSRRGGPRAELPLAAVNFQLFALAPLGAPSRVRRGRSFLLQAWGTVRDMTRLSVFALMSLDRSDLISACPECGVLFARIRRQRCCTLRCTRRANKRALRSTPKGRAAEAARKRRAYENTLSAQDRRRLRLRRAARTTTQGGPS